MQADALLATHKRSGTSNSLSSSVTFSSGESMDVDSVSVSPGVTSTSTALHRHEQFWPHARDDHRLSIMRLSLRLDCSIVVLRCIVTLRQRGPL